MYSQVVSASSVVQEMNWAWWHGWSLRHRRRRGEREIESTTRTITHIQLTNDHLRVAGGLGDFINGPHLGVGHSTNDEYNGSGSSLLGSLGLVCVCVCAINTSHKEENNLTSLLSAPPGLWLGTQFHRWRTLVVVIPVDLAELPELHPPVLPELERGLRMNGA